MSDNNRDDEQVKLYRLQEQTRHMNKTIEPVNFLQRKSNCTGDTLSILAKSAWPSLSGSMQPLPLMETALLLLTDTGKQDCGLFSMIKAHRSLQTVNLQITL